MPRRKKTDNGGVTAKKKPGRNVKTDPMVGKDTQFTSTNQPPNRGRKKILHNLAKEEGYNGEEIRRVMAHVLTLTDTEREKVMNENPDALTKLICRSIEKAAAKGEYAKAKEIIDQIAGRATQRQEHTGADGEPIFANVNWIGGNIDGAKQETEGSD